jgi:hypothetical protein
MGTVLAAEGKGVGLEGRGVGALRSMGNGCRVTLEESGGLMAGNIKKFLEIVGRNP